MLWHVILARKLSLLYALWVFFVVVLFFLMLYPTLGRKGTPIHIKISEAQTLKHL